MKNTNEFTKSDYINALSANSRAILAKYENITPPNINRQLTIGLINRLSDLVRQSPGSMYDAETTNADILSRVLSGKAVCLNDTEAKAYLQKQIINETNSDKIEDLKKQLEQIENVNSYFIADTQTYASLALPIPAALPDVSGIVLKDKGFLGNGIEIPAPTSNINPDWIDKSYDELDRADLLPSVFNDAPELFKDKYIKKFGELAYNRNYPSAAVAIEKKPAAVYEMSQGLIDKYSKMSWEELDRADVLPMLKDSAPDLFNRKLAEKKNKNIDIEYFLKHDWDTIDKADRISELAEMPSLYQEKFIQRFGRVPNKKF